VPFPLFKIYLSPSRFLTKNISMAMKNIFCHYI
jgi:hypothetical protein